MWGTRILTAKHCPATDDSVVRIGGLRKGDPYEDVGVELLARHSKLDLAVFKFVDDTSVGKIQVADDFPDAVSLYGWADGSQLNSELFQKVDPRDLNCDSGPNPEPCSGIQYVRSDRGVMTEDGDSGGPAASGKNEICGLIKGSKCDGVRVVDLSHDAVRRWLRHYMP